MAHGADGPADAGPVTVRGTDGAAGGLSPELGAVALAREQKCQQTVSGSESGYFALARGRRLDETKPGSGLGLSIVADLAKIYGGALTLEESDMGGLKATLRLPMA